MPVAKTCQHCQKPFSVPPSKVNKFNFCSIECKRLATPRCKCEKCGKEFTLKKSRLATGRGKYCSKACWSNRADKAESQCPICGKRVKFRISAPQVCCSRKCHGKLLAQTKSGENSVHWKGGCDDHRGANWRQQRQKARKRDGYKCQACGMSEKKNGRALDVHHIQRFGDFDDYKEANKLSNLVSLCMSCHGKAEHGLISFQTKLL